MSNPSSLPFSEFEIHKGIGRGAVDKIDRDPEDHGQHDDGRPGLAEVDDQVEGGRHAQHDGAEKERPVILQIIHEVPGIDRDRSPEEGKEPGKVEGQRLQVRNGEDHPGQGDQDPYEDGPQEGDMVYEPAEDELLQNDQDPQDQAPEDEIQRGPVPEARQQPYDHEIDHGGQSPLPAAAQGDIDIVPEPGAQGLVPSAVKIRYAVGRVGMVEVLDKAEAQHHAQASGHEGITPEVEIKLEGIGEGPHPGQRGGNGIIAHPADIVPEKADPVCQQDLHAKAHDEIDQAAFHLAEGDPSALLVKASLLEAHDGALGHLGEHGEIGRRVHKARLLLHPVPVDIQLEGDHLENVEGNADGKKTGPDQGGQELEAHQDGHVQTYHRQGILAPLGLETPASASARPVPVDGPHQIVGQGGKQKDQHEKPFAGSIEKNASAKEHGALESGRCDPVYDHEDRQKPEDEFHAGK